ncbi:MAG: glycogen synthase GlgA [Gammaproteobacteria bacterium]|nr:glycogen synthase GlgA [Gammaproteobacteria bacterium]
MKVLYVTSEAQPLVKTGGLADVSGALPQALKQRRVDVRLILPAYRATVEALGQVRVVGEIAGLDLPVRLLRGRLPGSEVPVWLVDCPPLFDRAGGPYSAPDGSDWPDNPERFALFSRVAVRVALDTAGLHWRPDVVHCHDWQTGLVPALLDGHADRPRTVFTIHNLAYQGSYPHETFARLALPDRLWSPEALEFYGRLALIKGGLAFADRLTTVSPTYAREICTASHGQGFDGLLRHRSDVLTGILNGADYAAWDPARDPRLAQPFGATTLPRRQRNKAALQHAFGLPEEEVTPLVAHIGRLAWQKGGDLIAEALPEMLDTGVQFVLLGSGDPVLERRLVALARRHPDRLAVRIGYDETLAHQIEGGADLFLMPSRYEPCGLNQIYSLRYGCVPVVRRTGGLADTVIDATPHAVRGGIATGVLFEEASPWAILEAVRRALALYRDRRRWRQVQRTGMAQDFSWDESAREYARLYREVVQEAGER